MTDIVHDNPPSTRTPEQRTNGRYPKSAREGLAPSAQLDEQLLFLTKTLDALSAHIAILDDRGIILAVNGAWRKFASLNEGDLVGFNVGDDYLSVCQSATSDCSEDAGNMFLGIRRVISGEIPSYYMQYECHTPMGPGYYQVRVTPFSGDHPNRFVVSHENITEAKLAEKELRDSQAQLAHLVRLGTMGELAAGIAHELNQPLSAIANYASGCSRRMTSVRDMVDPAILSALEEIAGQAERAGQIIRRLRNFVKRVEPKTAVLDVNDAVIEAMGLIESDAKLKRVRTSLELTDDLPGVVGDPIQVQQVLLNLARNAVEAIASQGPPHNGESLGDVCIRTSMRDPQTVQISVVDTGPGLPEQTLQRVFEPFFTTKESGLGLGLSLSSSIIDAHGGTLRCENRPEGGAVFLIALPAHHSAEHTPLGATP